MKKLERKPNAFLKCVSSCKYDAEANERTLFPKSEKHAPLTEAVKHDLGKVTFEKRFRHRHQ